MVTPLDNWDNLKRGYRHGDRTFYGAFYGALHRGVDKIGNKMPIKAPTECEIIVSRWFPKGGNTIWVEFGDNKYGALIMRCLHLDALPALGKYFEGATLAYSGNTGSLTRTPHLHLDLSKKPFNLYKFINFIDPDEYFDIPDVDEVFAQKWEGRFILDTEDHGELYYVNNGKRHYIGSEETIQTFAKKFATGFTHTDIEKIPEA